RCQIQWDYGVIHELGIALIVAAVLGFTIDFTLKTAIARDVFEATLGYILRPEFRNEVSRITGYTFLCERHVLVVEIKLLGNHVVEVMSTMERKLMNITSYPEKRRNSIHIDDWGFDNGPSEILECNATFQGQRFEGRPTKTEPFRLKQETKEVTVGPN